MLLPKRSIDSCANLLSFPSGRLCRVLVHGCFSNYARAVVGQAVLLTDHHQPEGSVATGTGNSWPEGLELE